MWIESVAQTVSRRLLQLFTDAERAYAAFDINSDGRVDYDVSRRAVA